MARRTSAMNNSTLLIVKHYIFLFPIVCVCVFALRVTLIQANRRMLEFIASLCVPYPPSSAYIISSVCDNNNY